MPKDAAIKANEPADVEVLPDGRVMISPVKVIRLHEAWALTPESMAQTEASLKDYKAGKTLGTAGLDAKIALAAPKRRGK
jgi:hypothetical protein